MTEMMNGEGQSANFAPATVNTSSTPTQAPAESVTERTFRQAEVNEIAARRASEAVERYKRESSIASHQPQQQSYAPPYSPQPPATHNPSTSPDEIRRLASEEIQRSRNEWQQESQRALEEENAKRIANEFFTKVGAGEGGIPAFEKTVAESGVDLRAIPYHVQLSNMVDNTREVMTELLKNPAKIGAIQNLIDIDLRAGRQPNLAMAEIKRLSASIKENAQAGKFQAPNDPLSQMRPSNHGTDNNGARSVRDYRSKYRI